MHSYSSEHKDTTEGQEETVTDVVLNDCKGAGSTHA